MDLFLAIVLFLALVLLVVLVVQMRNQRQATYELIADNRIRTRLHEDADETTSLVLSRTIHSISKGEADASLENDPFALMVVRELVKRRLPRDKWLELQSNQRLVHELFVLLRDNEEQEDRRS